MRFLFVSFVPDNTWSGMGKWTHRIAGELRLRGHEADLRFNDHWPALSRSGRLAVLLFPPLLAFWIARRRNRWNLVVIHEPIGFWYAVLRRFFRTMPPMLLMCHNVESRHFRAMVAATRLGAASVTWRGRIKNRLLRRWQSDGAIRGADAVLCLSTADERYILSMNRRVFRLMNGADTVLTAGTQAPAADSVLFVGGWLDVKGKRLLPAIWHATRKAAPGARLTVTGTGASEEAVLADFAEEDRASVSVKPRVHSPEEMNEIYRRNAIFLMPSISEGSPLSLLEAMAHGLAVVASRVGGIPDIATDEEDALLFESADVTAAAERIVRIIREPSLAASLGEAAALRAASLSWSASAEQFLFAAVSTAGGEA